MSGAPSFPSFRSAPRPPEQEKAVCLGKRKEQRLEKDTFTTSQETTNVKTLFYKDRVGDSDIAKYDFCLDKSQVPLHLLSAHSQSVFGLSPMERAQVLPTGEFTVIQATFKDGQQLSPRYFGRLPSETIKFGGMAVQRSTLYGDYISLTESDGESEGSMNLTSSEAVRGYPGVLTSPHDVQKWIEFVDSAYFDTRFPQQARRQRATAISSAALRENPESEPLIIKFMDLQRETQSPEIALRLWQLVLKKFPRNWFLRLAFLERYSSKWFSLYSVQQSLKYHIELLSDMLTVGEGDEGLVERIKLRSVNLLISSGHVEELVLLLYFLIWKNSRSTFAAHDPTEFTSYWIQKKAQYAKFATGPPNEKCDSLLRAELRADFSFESSEAEFTVLGSALSSGLSEPLIGSILSDLGLKFAEGHLDMQHSYWVLSQNFAVSAATTLSKAPLLTFDQILLLLTDLGSSLLFRYAEVLAAQLLCEKHDTGRALQLLKSCLSQKQSDMILWYHYTMLMRMTGSPTDQTLSVLDKLISSPNFASSPLRVQSLLMCSYCEMLCLAQRLQEARDLLVKAFELPSPTPSSLLKIKRALETDSDPQFARRWSLVLRHLCDQNMDLPDVLISNACPSTSAQSMAAIRAIYNASDKQEAQVLLMSLVQSAPYSKGISCLRANYLL